MLIKTIEVGHLETNCYIVTDEKTLKCAVIDPGDESNTILDYVESNNLKVTDIFITHGHFDHTKAAETVAEETGAVIWINRRDLGKRGAREYYKFITDREVMNYDEGDSIEVGGLTFDVIATPGHSEGSVTLKCEDALFVGDVLFKDSCGRTDLPGGNMDILLNSLRKLGSLEGDFEVYPGHMEQTSLSNEIQGNYYMRYALGK